MPATIVEMEKTMMNEEATLEGPIAESAEQPLPAQKSASLLQQYVRNAPVVSPGHTCRELLNIFELSATDECVVVCDHYQKPLGMLMRNRFYSRLRGRFSAELFYEKSVMKLADETPLMVEASMEAQQLIDLALSRDDQSLYDCVLVTSGGRLMGILTMSDLLKLSRRLQQMAVEEQKQMIASTEERLKEIEAAVRQTRESAGRGESLSMEMVDLTLTGKNELDKVKRAYHAISASSSLQERRMKELQAEAGSIRGMSKLIKELAEQSNLLAINASIEAARAGEHGRGFSVVAAEVMNLANQTKRSAGEITSVTESILRAIEQTSALAIEGRAETLSSEIYVNEAEGLFSQLFKAAAENRSSAKGIDGLSEQAHQRAVQVSQVMESLRQSYL